jgi:hypothetical protein
MSATLRMLAVFGWVLLLAGCATAPRVVGSGGSSSGDATIVAGGVIGRF